MEPASDQSVQRYYDPGIGRFLSVDPVTAYDTKDWRLFHRYGYAFNNPYGFTDPDGRRADDKNEPPPPSEPTTLETITVRGDPGSSLPQPCNDPVISCSGKERATHSSAPAES